MIYLDWASTTPVDKQVQEQLPHIIADAWGNPSSIHYSGRMAARVLEESRRKIAQYAGCNPEEIYFTSGATESNNMVLHSLLSRLAISPGGLKGKGVIISGIEHASVHEPAMALKRLGLEIKTLKAESDGRIKPEKIEKLLTRDTLLVSVMWVNNETGAIQPIREISDILKQGSAHSGRKILFHCDGVQGFGKLPLNLKEMGVDSASFSAHKIGGLKGAGALYVRKGAAYEFLYKGGKQEKKIRPGTENLPGISAFAIAAEERHRDLEAQLSRTRGLMSHLIGKLKDLKGAEIIPSQRKDNPQSDDFSPYILKVAFPPIPSEVLVRVLEDNRILVSTGSACSSGDRAKLIRVLTNMGVPTDVAESSIRISLGPESTEEELTELVHVLEKELPKLKILTG